VIILAFVLGLEDNGLEVDKFNAPPMALSTFKSKPSYPLTLIDNKMSR
jgi:hypothetical protein